MTTTFTKLAAYDKAIAEMQNSSRIQRRLGEGSPSLRSSHNGVFDVSSDSDSDASSPGSGGGSFGRHSFIAISEENNSPLSHGASYAFMASTRGSKMIQEEELARLSDIPLNGSNEIMVESQFAGFDRSIRSPTLGKDKRAEYFAQIKSQMREMHGAAAFPSTPPPLPPSSSPDIEEAPKRSRRFSLLAKDKLDIDKEKDDQENEEKSKRDKDNDPKLFDKKKEKEKQKEEKQRKKQEKKEQKQKIKAGDRDTATPSPENPRIMQQLLGAMRPRASLSQRGASELEEQLKRPIDISSTSPKEPATLRRSASFKGEIEDNRPKFERILGIPPVLDMNMSTAPTEDTKYNWRKTKIIKNVVSDPLPILQLQPNGLQIPNSPTLQNTIPESDEETPAKQKRTPKIIQLLGESPSIDINNLEGTNNTNTVVEMDIEEEGIVFSEVREPSGHRLIKGATLKKLVERLTCEYISDTNFLLQFIITYRSFTNPHELLELLKDRYLNGIEISADVTEAERETLTKKQLIVRLRVYNVIKQWIDKQWMDFIEDKTLVDKMLTYAPILNEVVSSKSSVMVEKLMEKRLAEGEKQKTIQFSTPPPPSYIPTLPRDKLQLMDINSEEIARQMTLIEYSLFKAIKPWEYLCWNTKAKQTKSANILAMINKFNMMSKWVQREVLHSGEQPRQRALTIGKFLEICEHLRTLKNFNGIMEILSGLNTSAVHRLKATWGYLTSKQNDVFQDFNTFTTGKNYKNLRTALHTLQPPCIPYLGMYLTDLTFINDGIPLYLPGDSCLINFDKCRKVSASVLEIMQYQQTPFCLSQVDDIQAYLSQVEKHQTETEDELFKLSLALEERK